LPHVTCMRYFEFDSAVSFWTCPEYIFVGSCQFCSSYRIVSSIMAPEECELPTWERRMEGSLTPPSYTSRTDTDTKLLSTPHKLTVFKALVFFTQYLVLLTVFLVMRQDFAKPATCSTKYIADVVLNCLPVFLITVFGDLISFWYVTPDWQYSAGHITAKVLGTIGVLFVSAAIWETTAAEHCLGFPTTNSTSFF
jgi:hypothetical protein